ncbi:MAG TPA: hypothetical protein VG674_06080 [Amycolatopsis sp.]|nr:hypothetical protein [Amycolatopsis sp.]
MSRAGLIAYPALAPYESPIPATVNPVSGGAMAGDAALSRPSISASTTTSSTAVPTTWSSNGPNQLSK